MKNLMAVCFRIKLRARKRFLRTSRASDSHTNRYHYLVSAIGYLRTNRQTYYI